MSVRKDISNFTSDITEDIRIRENKETTAISENELYDVNFKLDFNKQIYPVFLLLLIGIMILAFKAFGQPILECLIFGETFEPNGIYIIAAILIAFLILLTLLYSVYITLKKKPEVRKTRLYYKGSTYHYSQITKIKISAINIATIYVDGKKLFHITGDYTNYYAFLEWAKRCRVPIEKSRKNAKDLTESQITLITTLIVIVVIMITAVLYFFFR